MSDQIIGEMLIGLLFMGFGMWLMVFILKNIRR